MSKFIRGGKRPKNAREIYVEQLSYGRGITGSMGKKRETFTNMDPLDNRDLAYRSTSNYLREIAEQGLLSPTELMTAQSVPRTMSAGEIAASRNTVSRSTSGNPRYKAQEDYYDEIQIMKKDMKTIKDENSNLRSKIRRLEEDNARKRKEIDALYDSSKDGDLRRALAGSTTDRNNNNNNAAVASVVMSLKQRLFKSDLQLKEKEARIEELKSDPRWTKAVEYELQNRALLGEIERQKAQRLHHIETTDYDATLAEEQKNAVRKLTGEKEKIKQENQSLKRKIDELEKFKPVDTRSPQPSVRNYDEQSSKEMEELKRELHRANKDLQHTQNELDQVQHKLVQANKHIEKLERQSPRPSEDLEEIKRERDQFREKFNRADRALNEVKQERDGYKEQLDEANEKLVTMKREKDRLEHDLDELKPLRTFSPSSNSTSKNPNEIVDTLEIDKRGRNSPNAIPPSRITEKPSELTSKPSYERNPSEIVDILEMDKIGRKSPQTGTSSEKAAQNIQAVMRGHINRTEISKSPNSSAFAAVSPHHPHSPTGKDRGRSSRPNSHDDQGTPIHDDRDSPSRSRQRSGSPNDKRRSTPTPADRGISSKSNIRDDRTKADPDNRDSPSRSRQRSGSPNDKRRSTPTPADRGISSKSNIRDDQTKAGPDNRGSPSKSHQSTGSPIDKHPSATDRGGSSTPNRLDNRSPSSSKKPTPSKSPTPSKKTPKEMPSDDDDDLVVAGGGDF